VCGSNDDVREAADEALAILTHELSNPVAVIAGYADLLRDRPHAVDIPQLAERLRRQADVMTTVLADVSDVRALDGDSLKLVRRELDIAELVADVVESMRSDDLPITLHSPERLLVLADPVRMRQLLRNLLDNARTHTPPGTPATLTVDADDHHVVLTIADRGPGLPSDHVDDLFDKYARGNLQVRGTGLGLYLSRGIARVHGGDLTYQQPEPPEVGARFVLRLPRDRQSSQFAMASDSSSRALLSLNGVSAGSS
jgi:two-component system, OmpR family, sensor kinase